MDRHPLLLLALLLLTLAACDQRPTESLPAEPIESLFLRQWSFETHRRDGTRTLDGWYDQLAGVVSDQRVYGSMGIPISGTTENSHSEVYSNETGQTYWVKTQAPSGATDARDLIGTSVELWHRYGFRKTSPDAYIRFEITNVLFDALDGNPASPTLNDCPWFHFGEHPSLCGQTMQASVDYFLELFFPTTRGAHGEAEQRFREVIAIRESALGPRHPDVAAAVREYAGLLRGLGRTTEADSLESRGADRQ